MLRSCRLKGIVNDVCVFKWMNEQQTPPQDVMLFNEILSTGIPAQIIIVGFSDFNDCFVFESDCKKENKYTNIGKCPFLRREWEISPKILKINAC